MPSPAEVRAQLTDILTAVVECSPEQVTDDARLEDLGVDSLAAVEVADELGRRFGVHLADDVVDGLVTVADAVAAVVDHRPGDPRAPRTPVAPVALRSEGRPVPPQPRGRGRDVAGRADAFWRLALWFVVAGVALGGLVGFAGATVVRATGLGGVDLPPISAPTSETPTPTPTPPPTLLVPVQSLSGLGAVVWCGGLGVVYNFQLMHDDDGDGE